MIREFAVLVQETTPKRKPMLHRRFNVLSTEDTAEGAYAEALRHAGRMLKREAKAIRRRIRDAS